jgi:hypothetical protein
MSSREKPADGDLTERRVTRREIVSAGLGGVVASALTRLQVAQAAQIADLPMFLEVDNTSERTTSLSKSNFWHEPALKVENSYGIGVVGLGGSGGTLCDFCAVTIVNNFAAGVAGAGERVGIVGSGAPITIAAAAPESVPIGVWGNVGTRGERVSITHWNGSIPQGVGVLGSAPSPVLPSSGPYTITTPPAGVVGLAFGKDQTGVVAQNPSGTALQVDGGIAVSCGGRGVIPARHDRVEVLDPGVKTSTAVAVTLTGDPGNKGTSLQHVLVSEGALEIALTGVPSRDLPFSYLCFELAAHAVNEVRVVDKRG